MAISESEMRRQTNEQDVRGTEVVKRVSPR